MDITRYIKTNNFFKDYLPHIKQVANKLRGKTTRNQPIDFSDAERAEIRKALKQLAKDITAEKNIFIK